ncbi:hypothetical protein BaRGS_00021242 [Batillaria attramentaria]|uniref:PH domain-containing protein n=1 Tax=Batillaria attramentaria TaxID=370345 RepID=A0ABD0KL60_9CAEN
MALTLWMEALQKLACSGKLREKKLMDAEVEGMGVDRYESKIKRTLFAYFSRLDRQGRGAVWKGGPFVPARLRSVVMIVDLFINVQHQ